MAKRSATTELNHDNWNDEEEHEDAGSFKQASADILQKRVIKTARRKLGANSGEVVNFLNVLVYVTYNIIVYFIGKAECFCWIWWFWCKHA